jgi:hypothetical protein
MSMSATDYILTNDPQLQARVRSRYAKEIHALSALGFRPLGVTIEQLGPWSVILKFPMFFLMIVNREVLAFRSPLRLAAGNQLLFHTDPPAIALPMGMGTKIYTDFTDRTILISCTFPSYAVPRPGSSIAKIITSKGIDEAWHLHKQRVVEFQGEGKTAVVHSSFDDYVDMSRREEDLSQYSPPRL